MMEWEKEMGVQMGEEGHGCHGMLVRMLKLPWWQEGKARVVGGSHVNRRQALEEDATNPLLTTDLPDGGDGEEKQGSAWKIKNTDVQLKKENNAASVDRFPSLAESAPFSVLTVVSMGTALGCEFENQNRATQDCA